MLQQLKSQMNWDQKALEAWLEESAQRDDDAMTLQKYTRSDESKIKVSDFFFKFLKLPPKNGPLNLQGIFFLLL